MTKVKHKTTGEIYNVDSTYADRIKQQVTVYLKDRDGETKAALLPELMKDYEVITEYVLGRSKTIDDLKDGDVCYLISGTLITTCEWKNSEAQRLRRDIGDITLTKEEAEKKLAWRRAREILLRDTKGFKPAEENNYTSYEVYWDGVCGDQLMIDENYGADGTITFATKADAEASIKTHPNEWKTYLGVEE